MRAREREREGEGNEMVRNNSRVVEMTCRRRPTAALKRFPSLPLASSPFLAAPMLAVS